MVVRFDDDAPGVVAVDELPEPFFNVKVNFHLKFFHFFYQTQNSPGLRLLFSIASLISRSSSCFAVSLICFASSSGLPVSLEHSGSSFSGKNGVVVLVVPMCKTLVWRSMLHCEI